MNEIPGLTPEPSSKGQVDSDVKASGTSDNKTADINDKTKRPEMKPEPKEVTKIIDDDDVEAAYGYDLYPGRMGRQYQPSLKEHVFLHEGENAKDQVRCENNVNKCFRDNFGVRLMLDALKAAGCPVDISRNVSCETCEHVVTGGYDPSTNQIVVCQNTARHDNIVQGILVHELIHMFDFCTKKLDFTNLEHLACTEIRAANLTHCSFVSSVMQGDSGPFNIRKTHQDCVKNKAACSLVAARGVTKKEAVRIVDLVFPKCYADLEPIGRRVRRNSTDIRRAYLDRHRFGYV